MVGQITILDNFCREKLHIDVAQRYVSYSGEAIRRVMHFDSFGELPLVMGTGRLCLRIGCEVVEMIGMPSTHEPFESRNGLSCGRSSQQLAG
jgi:hypothetical protein